ncbi:MAG: ABC transporter ATP-binding protein, partial [Ferrimonas sp.]
QWPDKHADDTAMTDVLTQVGLVHCRNQMVAHLSGGEQQRLFIARALLQRPQVLLLDEPTNHLDVRYQIEILQLLKQLGITVICTLHDLNLAAAYCDQVALMEHGTIAAFGSPQSVLTTERIQRIYGVTCRINHATEACPPYPRILFDYRATTPAVQGGAHA